MYFPLPPDDDQPFLVSTGHLAAPPQVEALVKAAYQRYKGLDDGKVADYIPALAKVPRGLFGICIAGVDGSSFEIGDSKHQFSIQSGLQAVRLRAGQ